MYIENINGPADVKIFEKFFLHRPSGVYEPRKRVRP